jgi:hypothetical protein
MSIVGDLSGTLPHRAAMPPLPVSRLTVDHYLAMFRAGIVTEDDRIELLDGWLVPKATKTPLHCLATGLVRDGLRRIEPEGEDIGLVVEVADASLFCDQVVKKSIYAQAGIPCYWLVNLVDRRIEEYTEPVTSGENADYRQRRDCSGDVEIALVLDGRHIASVPVRDLLP